VSVCVCVCVSVRNAEIEWCHNAGILRSFLKSGANYSRWNEKKLGTITLGFKYERGRGCQIETP